MGRKRSKTNTYRDQAPKQKAGARKGLAWGGLALGFAALVVLFSLLLVFLHDLFTQSPYFYAKTVNVAGNNRLSEQEIRDQAGVLPGENILAVSLGRVRKRLLAHPWIDKASVARRYPDQIDIVISEREAVAVLDLGGRFLIDKRGDIFKRWEGTDPDDIPLVRGLSFSDVSVSGEAKSRVYEAVVGFLKEQKKKSWVIPAHALGEIKVDQDMGLTLVAMEPRVHVRLGFGAFDKKLRRLGEVFAFCEKSAEEAIMPVSVDLMDTERIVVNMGGDTPRQRRHRAGRFTNA